MSDPEVPQSKQSKDVNDVVESANAGLDAAEAARAEVPSNADESRQNDPVEADAAPTDSDVDPDLAAFEAAERDHPGTFATPELNAFAAEDAADTGRSADPAAPTQEQDVAARRSPSAVDVDYAGSDDTATRVVAPEPAPLASPTEPAVPTSAPQPIFVQAPEPPRERGNRGAAGGIGLIAAVAFTILYLGAVLGLGALSGDVTGANIGESAVAPLQTWAFWTPVVAFFLGFWFLGGFINRGRWGRWVIFGVIVGVIAYGGYLLGQLFEATFWFSGTTGVELVAANLLNPLAIAAFVFARELTIWFGAWVARAGARKTELNEEAQREYERTLEAGPTLTR